MFNILTSWNSSMVLPRFCCSMNLYAPIPVPESASMRTP